MPKAAVGCGFAAKTCAQAVEDVVVSYGNGHGLSTQAALGASHVWEKQAVLPVRLHKFFMRFSSGLAGFFTEVVAGFSPLSTPLIIRSMPVKKRNLFNRSGGLIAL